MKNKEKLSLNRCSHSLLGILLMCVFSLALSNCKSSGGTAAGQNKKLRVLLVGGGASHDFNKWFKGADVATLQRDDFAQVTYISHPDSILLLLPQTDVLYLSHN